MSCSVRTSECRKFSPNIFNKSKCSHCFHQRDEHSADAVECIRISRKVSKCGYLFVAPDWDFSNPLHRTKKWQRRWFVLYDDGELTYSLDEHPETIPQACIDMNKVHNVTTAENITGHTSSIAITSSERITFIKGTCPDESKWWLNILESYPKKSRYKRNTSILRKEQNLDSNSITICHRLDSYHKNNTDNSKNIKNICEEKYNTSANVVDDANCHIATGDDNIYGNNRKGAKTASIYNLTDRDKSSQSTEKDFTNRVSMSSILVKDIESDEKSIKDIAINIKLNQDEKIHSSTMNASVFDSQLHQSHSSHNTEYNSKDEIDFHRQPQQCKQLQTGVENHSSKSLPYNTTPTMVSTIVKSIEVANSTNNSTNNSSNNNISSKSINSNNININECKSNPRLQLHLKYFQQKYENNELQQQSQYTQQLQQQQTHERGDPDGGCNLDDFSINYLGNAPELCFNSKSKEYLKKGWLMKKGVGYGNWTKHWFKLIGGILFYYRDPDSEERGVCNGLFDVNCLTKIEEVKADKDYAFQLTSIGKHKLTLASPSLNLRNNWIGILCSFSGLPFLNIQQKDNIFTNFKFNVMKNEIDNDHDMLMLQETNNNANKNIDNKKMETAASLNIIISPDSITPKNTDIGTCSLNPITPKSKKHIVLYEDIQTKSDSGRDENTACSTLFSPVQKIDYTPSHVVSDSRLHKRSRSSSPNSKRSTVDIVGSCEFADLEDLNIHRKLQFRLCAIEKERDILKKDAEDRETRMIELLSTLERTEQKLNSRVKEMEELREHFTAQLHDERKNAKQIANRLSLGLEESQKKIKELEVQLVQGIDENETLYKRFQELEGSNNLSRSKIKYMGSLSDLTQIHYIEPYGLERDTLAEEYNELRSRFEKAVNEIKAMKRELKESQNQFDTLDISYTSLKKDLERKEIEDHSQLQMMAARIQDLTLKYTSSERQVRALKQKLTKLARRRSLSLKDKEQLNNSKELEIKLSELEAKINEIEKVVPEQKSTYNKTNAQIPVKGCRRKSLESYGSTELLQFMTRVNNLEQRIDSVSPSISKNAHSAPTNRSASPTSSNIKISTPQISEHLIERLCSLESVLLSSKHRLELCLQHLQNMHPSVTYHTISTMTERKDGFRFLERCISDVVNLISISYEKCTTNSVLDSSSDIKLEENPVKTALTQLEMQLRNKLSDLLKERRVLRDRKELTKQKELELLAERIAFESVCFGKLRDSITRAENSEMYGDHQTRAELVETSHLMTMLKAKLNGKCVFKASCSLDILAGVLARRLVLSTYQKNEKGCKPALAAVDCNILDDLLSQQNEINVIINHYKNNVMENLALSLAAETVNYISSNDLVKCTVQEAWRQAQESVNSELVQTEIEHVMMRNAERFQNSITPSFGYALTPTERITFEKFADAVHETLGKEMEIAVTMLTCCYKEKLQKMKHGNWRLHFEKEKRSSEGRQLLLEFADIIAHKALIDARINVLQAEYVNNQKCTPCTNYQSSGSKVCITSLLKYENLFEELSSDLQINNPDDILAESDFEFMYKHNGINFLTDRQVLSEISTFLHQLEDSLIALQCEADSTTTIEPTTISIENLHDVCQKCCELRERADQLLKDVHRKWKTPCQHCLQVREKLCNLQKQHDNEISNIQQTHTKELNLLILQFNNQKNALKLLEAEKEVIYNNLNKSKEIIEERDRKLKATIKKLESTEDILNDKEKYQIELLRKVKEMESNLLLYEEKSEALTVKCASQDEKFASFLQERDFLKSDLTKEMERSQKFEKRFKILELEHCKQLKCLQEAYREQLLSDCPDFGNESNEEIYRQRYQTEIEQLRTFCENGLKTIESSHRRLIRDLEEKHQQEIKRLLIEKETALAEETQATLAALDAMRKVHQSEVQREVALFKQEILEQLKKSGTLDTAQIREEELVELRHEILSFSEKYSMKCVENAVLEEKLQSVNQKLKSCQEMQQLELRNKQFHEYLASDNSTTDTAFKEVLHFKDGTVSKNYEV